MQNSFTFPHLAIPSLENHVERSYQTIWSFVVRIKRTNCTRRWIGYWMMEAETLHFRIFLLTRISGLTMLPWIPYHWKNFQVLRIFFEMRLLEGHTFTFASTSSLTTTRSILCPLCASTPILLGYLTPFQFTQGLVRVKPSMLAAVHKAETVRDLVAVHFI